MGLLVVVTALDEGFVCASIRFEAVLAHQDFAKADRWLGSDHALTQRYPKFAAPKKKGYGATVPYGHALLWYSSPDDGARGACFKLIVQRIVHDQAHRNTAIAPRLISITCTLIAGARIQAGRGRVSRHTSPRDC